MRYIRGFRDGGAAAALAQMIGVEAGSTREYHLMEFCGGHTHAIFRYGVEDLLPKNVRLVHGPGCPVCVLAMPRLNAAIDLSLRPNVTFVSYGDMVRVPASRRRSGAACSKCVRRGLTCGWCIRPSSPLISRQPIPTAKSSSLPSVRIETPATAHLIREAHRRGVSNLTVYCNHVVTPAAIQRHFGCTRGREWKQVRIDGFIGPSHVSAVIGSAPYEAFAHSYRKPVVIAGFEPLDVMQAVYMLVKQINQGRACVENQFTRGVTREGNIKAQALVAEVLELRPSFEWRGLGELAHSAMRIKSTYSQFDAEKRFAMPASPVRENAACQCPSIIRGQKKPTDCSLFGTTCTPPQSHRLLHGLGRRSLCGILQVSAHTRDRLALAADARGISGLNNAQRLSIGGCVQGVGYRPYIISPGTVVSADRLGAQQRGHRGDSRRGLSGTAGGICASHIRPAAADRPSALARARPGIG